jgi:ABC-type Fe3+ transport system permease subunit
VLLALVPALALLFKYVVAERLGVIILSALVAHTGWHWMLDRGEQLSKFSFPKLDAAFFASLMRGMMAALILWAIVWLLSGLVQRFLEARDEFAEKALARSPSSDRA